MSIIPRILVICCCAISPALADSQEWSSPPGQVTLVELYTSEGCSDCPPADHWLARLKGHPDLWRRIVPLGFHVDYWDYLGWDDRFARREHSNRQRRHKAVGNLKAVYTPGFVVNGAEWRGYFTRRRALPPTDAKPGILSAHLDGEDCSIHFEAANATGGPWVANVAWLGFDLENEISRGENRGKKLMHDFVVLAHHTAEAADGEWVVRSRAPKEARAIAVWISDPATLVPVQATGGWLAD